MSNDQNLRNEVYFAVNHVFRHGAVNIRSMKTIQKKLEKEQIKDHSQINDLIENHGMKKLCKIVHKLLVDGVFELTPQAMVSSWLPDVSPTPSEKLRSSQAGTAQSEPRTTPEAANWLNTKSNSVKEDKHVSSHLGNGKAMRSTPSPLC